MKILCVFGKYQYGKVSRGLSTEYFSFIPAFEALGHEVFHFESWDIFLYSDYVELNRNLIKTVEEINPEIIFAVTLGYEIWIESWQIIKQKTNCKLIHWCTDDSWKFREHSRFIAPYFDMMVTTYGEYISEYSKIGAKAFLSGWGCPDQWLCEPKKAYECKYKVTFVGSAHGNRKELVKAISDAGINIECFGYGWGNGAVDADKIPLIFIDSIISLNFANSKGENQIKARTFEVPGSGGFLITDDAKNLSAFFHDGKEIVVAHDLDDFILKIKYYLANPYLRDEIAFRGNDKVFEHYSYSKRAEAIIDYALQIPTKQFQSLDSTFDKIALKHKSTPFLHLFKVVLLSVGYIIFGRTRGRRFARRLAFEIEWRMRGVKTYSASGWTERMFCGY